MTVIVAVTVGLLAMASPFLGVTWGSVDHRVLPEGAPAHEAAEVLNTEFGTETSTANLLLTDVSEADVASYRRDVLDVPGVVAVDPVDQEGSTFLLRATWEGNSQTTASQELVEQVRTIDPPSTRSCSGKRRSGSMRDSPVSATSVRAGNPGDWSADARVATLDIFSNGRVDVGVGRRYAGGFRVELERREDIAGAVAGDIIDLGPQPIAEHVEHLASVAHAAAPSRQSRVVPEAAGQHAGQCQAHGFGQRAHGATPRCSRRTPCSSSGTCRW